MSNSKTFKTSELPQSIKALVALTGRRPRSVCVAFQSGPTKVYGAFRTDAESFGKVVESDVTYWTGSDGEPNTSVTEVWDSPVARDTTGYSKKVHVTVTIGNLRELCPADAKTVTPAMLDMLFKASTETPVEATGKQTHIARPGPFNDLKADTVTYEQALDLTGANVVSPVDNDHVAMLDQLGLN